MLLPAVLVIWGLIFQRIWSAARGNAETLTPAQELSPPVAITGSEHLPRLSLNYPDPFRLSSPGPAASYQGGTPNAVPIHYGHPLASASLNLPVAPTAVPVVPLAWPQIKYMGFINNPRFENRIALLAINEKEYPLKPGENKEEILVTKIWRDSIQVAFKGHKKTVIRAALN